MAETFIGGFGAYGNPFARANHTHKRNRQDMVHTCEYINFRSKSSN